jgi:hypothetical protein
VNAAARNLGAAIVSGMISGVASLAGGFLSRIEGLANDALGIARHVLSIFSPSKAFEFIGKMMVAGWGLGVDKNGSLVTAATNSVGRDVLDTVTRNMAAVNSLVDNSLNIQPTITPVIDLTKAQDGIATLNKLTKTQLISAQTSTSSAATIAAQASVSAQGSGATSANGVSLTFNQTNQSPVALSAVDIYRRTRNQLSQAKGAIASANRS